MKKYDFPVENILHLNAFTPNTLKEEKNRIEFENTIKTPTLELYENFVKEYKLDFSNFSRNFD
jgi:regulator of sirC expression with transglutaminase-like and TPR domain